MSVRELAPQFTVVCDWCGAEPDFDGVTLYFPRERIDAGALECRYRTLDGRHMCPHCSEVRGVDPEELPDELPGEPMREPPATPVSIWLCPICGECQKAVGVEAHCAGSATERTAHRDILMVRGLARRMEP